MEINKSSVDVFHNENKDVYNICDDDKREFSRCIIFTGLITKYDDVAFLFWTICKL